MKCRWPSVGRPVMHGAALRGLLASRVFVSTLFGLLMTHRSMFRPRGCVLASSRPRDKNVVSARTNFRKAPDPPPRHPPPPTLTKTGLILRRFASLFNTTCFLLINNLIDLMRSDFAGFGPSCTGHPLVGLGLVRPGVDTGADGTRWQPPRPPAVLREVS